MMKKLVILLLAITFVYGDMSERFLKDTHEKGQDSLNATFDMGYGVYLIDVTSSELSRAIDYRVLQATIGVSYSIGRGNIGISSNVVIKEKKSNLFLEDFDTPLNDEASIDRKDFSLYGNYYFNKNSLINVVYKYYSLKANDHYLNFRSYDTYFNYSSSGLAISYVYTQELNYHDSRLFFGVGGLYGNAKVEIFEKIDGVRDDVFIDDSQGALGLKLALGYIYKVDNLKFRIMLDWQRYDFGTLDVESEFLGKTIEQATLSEESYSIRFGYIHKF